MKQELQKRKQETKKQDNENEMMGKRFQKNDGNKHKEVKRVRTNWKRKEPKHKQKENVAYKQN